VRNELIVSQRGCKNSYRILSCRVTEREQGHVVTGTDKASQNVCTLFAEADP